MKQRKDGWSFKQMAFKEQKVTREKKHKELQIGRAGSQMPRTHNELEKIM